MQRAFVSTTSEIMHVVPAVEKKCITFPESAFGPRCVSIAEATLQMTQRHLVWPNVSPRRGEWEWESVWEERTGRDWGIRTFLSQRLCRPAKGASGKGCRDKNEGRGEGGECKHTQQTLHPSPVPAAFKVSFPLPPQSLSPANLSHPVKLTWALFASLFSVQLILSGMRSFERQVLKSFA